MLFRSFFLKKNNIKSFFVWDDNWISKKANKKKNQIKILSEEIINSDYIVISPGIQISKAIAKNILKRYTKKIITDLDIFYLFYPNLKTIMVTGTNGKSTTCELLKNLFQKTKNIMFIYQVILEDQYSMKDQKIEVYL